MFGFGKFGMYRSSSVRSRFGMVVAGALIGIGDISRSINRVAVRPVGVCFRQSWRGESRHGMVW